VAYSSPEAPSRLLLAVGGDLRSGLTATFAEAGFVVTTALPSGDVDCLAEAQTPQVVVLDTELGGEAEALRAGLALRAKAATADVPVLLLIASSAPLVVDHGLESGVTDVAMRISPAALVKHRVQEMLRVKRRIDDLRRSEWSLEHAQPIARLGNWPWDPVEDLVTWSAKVDRLLDVPDTTSSATMDVFLARVHAQDKAICDDLSRATGVMGTLQDITERTATENRI